MSGVGTHVNLYISSISVRIAALGGFGVSDAWTSSSWARCVAVAVVFCLALGSLAIYPARGAVPFTGSVSPTDSAGTPTTVFVRGQPVYSNIGLNFDGAPYDGTIRAELRRSTGGALVSSFNARTNNPVVGWNNGSVSGLFLSTAAPFSGSEMAYDVMVYYTGGGSNDLVARTPVLVLAEGLQISPQSNPYYPGEEVALKLVTSHTTDLFYVQIVNLTGATWANWTGQMAPDGTWAAGWTIPDDFPDGQYWVNVRAAVTHAIWYQSFIMVMKYQLFVQPDHTYWLPGDTAHVYYLALDMATFAPSTGVSIEYEAHWVNASGSDRWGSGSLPGVEGTQDFLIPADAALYADVEIAYWANESSSGRSSENYAVLYLGELSGTLSVSSSSFSPGEDVLIAVSAEVEYEGLPGATVNISIEYEGSALPVYGATGLTTDVAGQVTHSFMLDPAAVEGTYVVNVTIERVGHAVHLMAVFNVVSTAQVLIAFDKPYYYSGDTALVQMLVVRNGVQLMNQNLTYIVIVGAVVLLTGQNTTGSLSCAIPADFFGILLVEAIGNLDGTIVEGLASCDVALADLSLVSESSEYIPGDRIVFDYQLNTNLAAGTIEWQITDANGIVVASGSPAFSKTGSFYFDTPTMWCPDSYTARVSFQSSSGGYLESYATVSKAAVPPVTLMPFLRVDNPAEGATTDIPVIHASGASEPGILLSVNGFTVLAGTNGTFSLNLPLLEGTNTITITADNWIAQTTITRNVTYVNSVPGLVSQVSQLMLDLAQSQSTISSIWSQLNGTDAQVSDVWAQLNASESAIATVWSEANLTETSLGILQAQVDALRAEMTLTHSTLNGTSASLSSLESSVNAAQAQIDTTRASLNSTMADLAAAQTQLDSLKSGLDTAQGDIGAKASNSSVMMWFAVAVVVSIAFAAALFVVLRRKV